jgi:WD40 repeat protein
MTDAASVATPELECFPSLESLRAAHSELLQRFQAQGAMPDLIAAIEAFLRRGTATGVLLDSDADRWAAQSRLDYWLTQLYRPGYTPPDVTLAEFDPELAPELAEELCPYVGLDAFHEKDQGRFFGRTRLLDESFERLKDLKLLAVIGPSGSGKSSLVRAGLIPRLKHPHLLINQRMPGGADWFCFTPMVPGSHPLDNLARLLLMPGEGQPQAQAIVARLSESPQALASLLRERFTTNVVLVIDQFEETFTLCTDDHARQMFVANLTALSQSAEAEHRVIVTMRTDFVSHVARFPDLQSLFEKGQITVGPLGAAELREVIIAPAALIGLKFEDGVVQALVDDTLGEPAALPLLQFTLLRLWENRDRNRVTWETYRKLGGGRLALARAADDFYNNLIPEEQITARRIMLKMVRPGEGLEVTSNRVPRASLYYKAEAADRIDRVLAKLIKARLVRVSEGDTAADEQIEVAHEALVRNWPRLVDWLDEDRALLRQRQRLTAAAEQWLRVGKDATALWRGVLLEQARQVDDLNELETEFIQAGVQEELAVQAAAEAQRQKELEAAQKLAAAEAARARESERAAVRLRRASRIIAAVSVLAVLLAMVAVVFAVQANEARGQAEKAEHVATSRNIAAEALSLVNFDPDQGVVRAFDALSTSFTPEALDALRQLLASNTLLVLSGHRAPVYSAEYSPSGEWIVTASKDEARIWDAAQGSGIKPLRGHNGSIHSAHYSPDGKYIVTAGEDGTVRTWAVSTGREETQRRLRGLQGTAYDARFSTDGTRMVTAGEDGTARIWEAASGAPIGEPLRGHNGAVFSAAYSSDGTRIVTTGEDGTVRIWDAASGAAIGEPLRGHRGAVFNAQYSPDGGQIASAGDDGLVLIWDANSRQAAGEPLRGHEGSVYSARYSSDGTQIVTTGEDRTVRIWDVRTRQELVRLLGHANAVHSAQFSPDNQRIVTASDDRTARVWEVVPSFEVAVWLGHSGSINDVHYSPDGRRIVTAGDDGTVRLWDVGSHQDVGTPLRGHSGPVFSAVFSPDGAKLLTSGKDQTARIWNVEAGLQDGGELRGHEGAVLDAQYSPDGAQIVTAGRDGDIRLWDAATHQQIGDPLSGHTGEVYSAKYSLDGKSIVTASADQTARIWNTAKRQAVKVFRGHEGPVYYATFSPDGTHIATVGEDQTVRFWDVATEAAQVLSGHTDAVTGVWFSPDGAQLITISYDGTTRIWDVATGQTVDVLRGHDGPVTSAQYSPDGKQIVTSGADGMILIHFVRIADLIARFRERISELPLPCEVRVRFLHESRNCSSP